MRYMLFNQHTKPGVPVKRQDLTNLIMGGYRGSTKMKKLGNLIIKQAQNKFITICGLEMKEVIPQLHSRQGLPFQSHCRADRMPSGFYGGKFVEVIWSKTPLT